MSNQFLVIHLNNIESGFAPEKFGGTFGSKQENGKDFYSVIKEKVTQHDNLFAPGL